MTASRRGAAAELAEEHTGRCSRCGQRIDERTYPLGFVNLHTATKPHKAGDIIDAAAVVQVNGFVAHRLVVPESVRESFLAFEGSFHAYPVDTPKQS